MRRDNKITLRQSTAPRSNALYCILVCAGVLRGSTLNKVKLSMDVFLACIELVAIRKLQNATHYTQRLHTTPPQSSADRKHKILTIEDGAQFSGRCDIIVDE